MQILLKTLTGKTAMHHTLRGLARQLMNLIINTFLIQRFIFLDMTSQAYTLYNLIVQILMKTLSGKAVMNNFLRAILNLIMLQLTKLIVQIMSLLKLTNVIVQIMSLIINISFHIHRLMKFFMSLKYILVMEGFQQLMDLIIDIPYRKFLQMGVLVILLQMMLMSLIVNTYISLVQQLMSQIIHTFHVL